LSQQEIFQLPCTDPQFLSRVFPHLLEAKASHPLSQLFDLKQEAILSFYFDSSGLQDSWRFRALSRARRLSLSLVGEKGEIKKELLEHFINLFEQEGYLFYPTGLNDGALVEHILPTLRFLHSEEALKSLKRFQGPLFSKWAERLVFETLGIPASSSPTDAQIRAAVLCACLTPLRQNVGSCFATAPAILIQSETPALLLEDLYQLLTTGKLKRIFGGVEYSVPLSPNPGVGDLKRNILPLKPTLSPGAVAALEAIEVTDGKMRIAELAQGKSSLTMQEVIHSLLLKKFSLSEADLESGKRLELSQLKSAKMGVLTPSTKLGKVSAFWEKERQASFAFQGMCDNALLKSWEFTIASFSEVKMEFSRWNLYSSLGLASEEAGGIGEVLYRRLDEKINDINKKLEEYQKQYEIAFDQVKSTEAMFRNVSSDSEARRLQAEYQSRSYHLRACLEMRDSLYSKGSNLSKLFSFLVQQYGEKFPDYFQEIYDAQMQDFQGDLYDDSPAGFRLVYKHGRPDPSSWTLIYDSNAYIDALLDFFSATSAQIAANCEWEGGSDDILELTSAIIAHIRTPFFLESALHRMAKAHQTAPIASPMSRLHQIEKKPWAYTSGGTMTTLLKTYYRRESELTQEGKWVESETELLIFILDTLKSLPTNITDPYLKKTRKRMLMTSPSHAFSLFPGQEEFVKGWQEEMFTYTWVRDEIFLPSQKFYAEMLLNPEEQRFLLSTFCRQFPPASALEHIDLPRGKKLTPIEWRNHIVKAAAKPQVADALDSFLYQSLPLVPTREWKSIVRKIFSDQKNEKLEAVLAKFLDPAVPFCTAKELRDAAKGCYLLAENTIALSFDLHHFVAKHARFIDLGSPTPLLFADTNWCGYYFGFVVNPGTGRLELWRLDRTLSTGVPMTEWKQWLRGVDRKNWSIFTRPFEYQG
jgi:hypothetical protein